MESVVLEILQTEINNKLKDKQNNLYTIDIR